jgi:hypothetical protein
MMERRKHKRIYINETAEISLDDKTYKGYIVDVSEKGIGFMLSSPFNARDEKVNNTVIELRSEQTGPLNCEVIWIKKGSLTDSTVALGMKIINPSDKYRAWMETILTSRSQCDLN